MDETDKAALMRRIDAALVQVISMEGRILAVIEGNRSQLSALFDSLNLRELRQELRDIRQLM